MGWCSWLAGPSRHPLCWLADSDTSGCGPDFAHPDPSSIPNKIHHALHIPSRCLGYVLVERIEKENQLDRDFWQTFITHSTHPQTNTHTHTPQANTQANTPSFFLCCMYVYRIALSPSPSLQAFSNSVAPDLLISRYVIATKRSLMSLIRDSQRIQRL